MDYKHKFCVGECARAWHPLPAESSKSVLWQLFEGRLEITHVCMQPLWIAGKYSKKWIQMTIRKASLFVAPLITKGPVP